MHTPLIRLFGGGQTTGGAVHTPLITEFGGKQVGGGAVHTPLIIVSGELQLPPPPDIIPPPPPGIIGMIGIMMCIGNVAKNLTLNDSVSPLPDPVVVPAPGVPALEVGEAMPAPGNS